MKTKVTQAALVPSLARRSFCERKDASSNLWSQGADDKDDVSCLSTLRQLLTDPGPPAAASSSVVTAFSFSSLPPTVRTRCFEVLG